MPFAVKSTSTPKASFIAIAITARYFEEQGVQARTIRLYGNVEIAPATGVADAIVDLVDTGGTLSANGLVPIREIFSATARLIVNLRDYLGGLQTDLGQFADPPPKLNHLYCRRWQR